MDGSGQAHGRGRGGRFARRHHGWCFPGVLVASEKAGHPLALQPEGLPSEEALAWNEMSWGYWSYPFVPMVSRYKWLETRHMPVVTSGGRHHMEGIQAAFFNGVGYADQEDVIGIHNGFTRRELEALRRVLTIDRANASLLVSPVWEPYAPTLKYGVFASKFPGKHRTLWTVINRNSYDVRSPAHRAVWPRQRFFDLWHGVELIPQISSSSPKTATAPQLRHGVARLWSGVVDSHWTISECLDALLGQMHTFATKTFADYSDHGPITATMVEIPRQPRPEDAARNGAVRRGTFDFKVRAFRSPVAT